MKKITLIIAAMMVSLASFAQFEADKFYIGASLSSFDLSYNGLTKGNIGMQAKGGYFVSDNLMALAQLGGCTLFVVCRLGRPLLYRSERFVSGCLCRL